MMAFNYCKIHNIEEIQDLKEGMDFRKPKYRREVFMRFYEFHLKYSSHPGCVYYLFPYLIDNMNLNQEQKFWLAYLNGITQNMCTTYVIFKNFPNYEKLNIDEITKWHIKNWKKLDYDTDRRYQKGHLVEMIINYKNVVGKNQFKYFAPKCFDEIWGEVYYNFYMFGRLSTFSYLEYLRIIGLNIEPSHLYLDDYSGSMSHRNGLLKVMGRDDLDQHKSNLRWNKKDKLHNSFVIHECEKYGESLLNEAKIKFKDRVFYKDVNYFTLESTLCTYKSWYRKNRRYPNVYNDMFYNRIKKAEKNWGKEFNIFWDIRKKFLPKKLRLEDNLNDPGLSKVKQNYFRETGEVVMMDNDWGCFNNNFNKTLKETTLCFE